MTKMTQHILLLSLLASPPALAKGKAGPGAVTQAQLVDSCVKNREEALACKDPFIDAMIEMRARHQPPIAEAIKTPAGKQQTRETGLKELAADGGGPAAERRSKCEAVAGHMQMSRADMDALTACYTKADCAAKVACMIPILERGMFADAAKAEPNKKAP